jgi:phospholipid/cholesterol/gamma-HCH transport system permease protein
MLTKLGANTIKTVYAFGHFGRFVSDTFVACGNCCIKAKMYVLIWTQMYLIGVRSVGVIMATGTFVGMTLALQAYDQLFGMGLEERLGVLINVSVVKELGPVLAAVMLAGRVGGALTAELGTMKVTEQIDAMEVSSTNPVKYLIVTRVLAATLMIPLLVLYADALGIMGSWAGANLKGDVTFILFFSQAFSHIGFIDLIPAIIKTFFFGAVIGLVGCYKGYTAGRGTESVGIAANSAVVLSSLLVIIVDLIAVQITDLL